MNEYSANGDLLGASQPGQLNGSTDRIKQSRVCLDLIRHEPHLGSLSELVSQAINIKLFH